MVDEKLTLSCAANGRSSVTADLVRNKIAGLVAILPPPPEKKIARGVALSIVASKNSIAMPSLSSQRDINKTVLPIAPENSESGKRSFPFHSHTKKLVFENEKVLAEHLYFTTTMTLPLAKLQFENKCMPLSHR